MEIGDPQGQRFETIDALADTGASLTMMPESLVRRLGVTPTRSLDFKNASGVVESRPVADTHMRVEGMDIISAVAFGEEGIFLLGAQTLEGLNLAVDPVNKRLLRVTGLMM